MTRPNISLSSWLLSEEKRLSGRTQIDMPGFMKRVIIFGHIMANDDKGGSTVSLIELTHNISKSNVLYHLRIMEKRGWIKPEKPDETHVFYRLSTNMRNKIIREQLERVRKEIKDIIQIIRENPGIHFRGIHREYKKRYDSQLSTRRLEGRIAELLKHKLVKAVSSYKKRFYLNDQLIDKSLPERILEKIKEYFNRHNKGITIKELAESLGVSERVIRHNLKKISQDIRMEKDGKFIRYLPSKTV